MAAIHLIIPDTALRDALTEQLKLAKLDAKAGGDITDALQDDDARILIIDGPALDKKSCKLLSSVDHGKYVFAFGATVAEAEGLITESFPKPMRLGHILARLAFYLDVAPRLRGTPITFGPFRLESQNRQLVIDGSDTVIRLTEKETAILEYLGQSNEPVTRDELLGAIWGYDARIDTHTLETHIYQLRRKLDPEAKGLDLLINEHSAYRLNRA